MKTISALILALLSGAAQAGWVQVGPEAARTRYADPTTISKNGKTATMLSLIEFKNFQRMVEVGYFSQKFRVEYDCAAARARQLTQHFHADHMGAGTVVYSDDTAQDWVDIASGSLEEDLRKLACN